MTSLREAVGKPVILRETAEKVGEVRGFAVDATGPRVVSMVISAGRSARVADWSEIQNVGPDAVIIESSREPGSDDERAVAGALDPLDKRVLSDLGNELGRSTDAEIDDDGVIQHLAVGDDRIEGTRLRGVGSYAVVIEADPSEA